MLVVIEVHRLVEWGHFVGTDTNIVQGNLANGLRPLDQATMLYTCDIHPFESDEND